MLHPTNHIFEFNPETLADWCDARRMPGFRAKQILEWVYEKGIADPAQMSSLSKVDREVLSREMTFLSGKVLRHMQATDGTQKLLVEWDDGNPPPAPPEGVADAAIAPTPTLTTSATDPAPGHKRLSLTQATEAIGDTSRQTECVMIPAENEEGQRRFTACISSQVGCPVGCRFCASGLTGLDSNLSAVRIVEQV